MVTGLFAFPGLLVEGAQRPFSHIFPTWAPDTAVGIGLNGAPLTPRLDVYALLKPLPSGTGRCNAPEQDGRRDLEGVRQPDERRDAGIAQSALDPGNLGHVDARAMADLFLSEMPALSRSGDVLCEDIEGRHPRDGLVKLA